MECANVSSGFLSVMPIQDMFDFDNMGFTNTVENIKYLSCSDCEVTRAKCSLLS